MADRPPSYATPPRPQTTKSSAQKRWKKVSEIGRSRSMDFSRVVEEQVDEEKRRGNWQPDAATRSCQCSSCNEGGRLFGLTYRRHHCRNCGKVVCGACSKQRRECAHLGWGSVPQRVCDDCAGDEALLLWTVLRADKELSASACIDSASLEKALRRPRRSTEGIAVPPEAVTRLLTAAEEVGAASPPSERSIEALRRALDNSNNSNNNSGGGSEPGSGGSGGIGGAAGGGSPFSEPTFMFGHSPRASSKQQQQQQQRQPPALVSSPGKPLSLHEMKTPVLASRNGGNGVNSSGSSNSVKDRGATNKGSTGSRGGGPANLLPKSSDDNGPAIAAGAGAGAGAGAAPSAMNPSSDSHRQLQERPAAVSDLDLDRKPSVTSKDSSSSSSSTAATTSIRDTTVTAGGQRAASAMATSAGSSDAAGVAPAAEAEAGAGAGLSTATASRQGATDGKKHQVVGSLGSTKGGVTTNQTPTTPSGASVATSSNGAGSDLARFLAIAAVGAAVAAGAVWYTKMRSN